MRAVQIDRFEGPDSLNLVELDEPVALDGQVVLDVEAAGVNFSDVWLTKNAWGLPIALPCVPGQEVVGRCGDGSRVVAFCPSGGGYAERVAVDREATLALPDSVDARAATAALVQGSTAWLLLTAAGHLAAGETVLILAAAGGVGSLVIQLARQLGAGTVIAAASTAEKRSLCKRLGADVTIHSSPAGLLDAVREATDGRGVDLALDSVAGPAFDACLQALAPMGRLINFGIASGEAPSMVAPRELTVRNVTIGGLWLKTFGLPDLMTPAAEVLSRFADGQLSVVDGGTYPLENAADALRLLGDGATTGKVLIAPSPGASAGTRRAGQRSH